MPTVGASIAVSKRTLHAVGSLVATLGICFVGVKLWDQFQTQGMKHLEPWMILILVLLSIAYMASCAIHPLAWRQILRQLGFEATKRWSIKTYGRTQLAKYLPGNVFHIAGRQVMGMAAGIPSAIVAKSIGVEMTMFLITGGTFGVMLIDILLPEHLRIIGMISWLMATALSYATCRKLIGEPAGKAFALQIAFHLFSCSTFSIVYLMNGGSQSDLYLVAPAYVIAWLVGTLTPGAPAGVGIRELVLIFILGAKMEQSLLISTVAMGRLVTVSADVMLFFVASVIPGDKPKSLVET